MQQQLYTSLFILLLLLLPFKSTSQSIQNQITGTWNFNYEKSLDLMDENAKKHFDKMKDARKEKVKQAYVDRKVILMENGAFVQEFSDGRKVDATWVFASKGSRNKIKVSDSRGVRWFKIKELKGNTLIIAPIKENDKRANMLISQWVLTRVID